jgi:hypothetical protein
MSISSNHAGIVEGATPRLERVQRHRDEIERQQPLVRDLRHVGRGTAAREDRRVHVRMQRLHTSAEHLAESGPVLDGRHLDARLPQVHGRP